MYLSLCPMTFETVKFPPQKIYFMHFSPWYFFSRKAFQFDPNTRWFEGTFGLRVFIRFSTCWGEIPGEKQAVSSRRDFSCLEFQSNTSGVMWDIPGGISRYNLRLIWLTLTCKLSFKEVTRKVGNGQLRSFMHCHNFDNRLKIPKQSPCAPKSLRLLFFKRWKKQQRCYHGDTRGFMTFL